MNSASLFIRFMLGAVLAIGSLEADAKPQKERGKKRSESAGEVRQKAAKAPQRSVRQSAPRQRKVAKAPSRQDASKPARSKPRAAIAQERRGSPSANRSKAVASKADGRIEKRARPQQDTRGNRRPSELAGGQKETRRERGAKIAGVDSGKVEQRDRDVDMSPAERKEGRIESAQEQDRRAQRVRERERIAQNRRPQLADRHERHRERVERFRDNRQRRFAAVQRQRAALRATRIAARREYQEEVRDEIREYWEDRAEEVRDRIRDRHDDLFDDNWWEHRHWYHGPILVSSPWWWWHPARWGAVNVFIGAGWSEPISYDYGTDVIYDDDLVYVHGEPVGSRVEYTRSVVELANPPIPAVANVPVTEENWQPLGVWALAQEDQGDAVMFFQLSVNKNGVISGAYSNVMSGEELPLVGQVDRKTQRAAWHIGDQREKVFEAGMANLTQDQASCLVHLGKGESQNWLLVRMPDPTLPNEPKTIGQVAQ
jgi:hypothetical protein